MLERCDRIIVLNHGRVQWALQQILNCPYEGWTRQLYLEGKVLELIALQTHQYCQAAPIVPSGVSLKPAQIEQIHAAADLLERYLDDSPSLLQLARWVGLNDCTLKRGFKQVFGTTVFGYLRQRRLEQARELLLEQEMSVTEAATAVGYTHVGHFAAAFKRAFGVSPRQLRQ
ncbi:AraC-type DNA binding domain protein [Halomicronema hongdechloris C2206]|uniref:AraC-type DNA binding domain protein n=1 Tax=Halomicronema hongdechloris C2206 TaxID=1641165 RepID=A0A1Z3HN59_9CYAN|nr:AraC-type DNA binding domain protein [Halomicronema hongdechloris C2206]